MKTKLINEIKLKSGEIISAGTSVDVKWDSNHYHLAFLHIEGEGKEKAIRISNARLHKYISEAREPMSVEELEESVNDCVCETILGNTTEPDGTDENGAPSWLLSMGLI